MAGLGVGSSLDFQDHRAYLPGDDPRQINWQAYARTGHYSMKLYREEVRPLVDIVLDASPSMWAFPTKAARAAELLYFAADSARRTGASLRFFAVNGEAVTTLSEESVAGDRWPADLAAAFPHPTNRATPPHAPPAMARLPFRLGSLRTVITDLLFPGAPEPVLQPLVARQGRAVVFAPTATEESAPDWDGNFEFIEAEARSHHRHRIDKAAFQKYTEAYRRHFELWKSSALRHGLALARVPSTGDLGAALRAEAVPVGAVEF